MRPDKAMTWPLIIPKHTDEPTAPAVFLRFCQSPDGKVMFGRLCHFFELAKRLAGSCTPRQSLLIPRMGDKFEMRSFRGESTEMMTHCEGRLGRGLAEPITLDLEESIGHW